MRKSGLLIAAIAAFSIAGSASAEEIECPKDAGEVVHISFGVNNVYKHIKATADGQSTVGRVCNMDGSAGRVVLYMPKADGAFWEFDPRILETEAGRIKFAEYLKAHGSHIGEKPPGS